MHHIDVSGISLQDIQIFLAAAEHENFTRAAQSLYLSQSFLSKRIMALEKATGLYLFVRDKRGVTLTDAGRLLQEKLKNINEDVFRAFQQARDLQAGVEQSLRIGMIRLGDYFFLDTIMKFRNRNPQIALRAEQFMFKELRDKFVDGDLDLIFTTTYEIDYLPKTHYNSLILQEAPLVAVMSRENPLAGKKSIQVSDLENQLLLMVHAQDSPGFVKMLDDLFGQHGFVPRVSYYAQDGSSQLLNVLMNEGVLVVTKYFLWNHADPRICQVPIESTSGGIGIAWRKTNKNPALEKFIRHLTYSDISGVKL
ncbi:MAG: LysR family transcriptional regulator [Firmicutes bacterium]|nr:LysR family transcriptional regulator [Bacillota bacterium]